MSYDPKTRQNDYDMVFHGENGDRVLKDILTYCHMLEPMPDSDPNMALVREARRDVANMILSAMNFKIQDYEELTK